MRKFILILMTLLLVAIVSLASAELKLRPLHRHETAEHSFENRYSLDNALSCVEGIQGSLQSLRQLTEKAAGKISPEVLKQIGNTDWETQNLGFKNWVNSVEGTLRKQDYLIKQLQYQLAQEKFKQGTGSGKDVKEAQRIYQESENSFQKFWDRSFIAD